MCKKISIAIDGPASAGKSTVAKIVAQTLNYIYCDTGAMYRVLTYKALQEEVDVADEKELVALLKKIEITFQQTDKEQLVFLDGKNVTQEIRENYVTNNVSEVAAHKLIRQDLVKRQQKIAQNGGIVMDGRDIGTAVLPEAEVKIFLVASVSERAERRYKENLAKGIPTDYETLKKEIEKRDYYDSNRKVTPLVQAKDAIKIDTTGMSIEEVVKKILYYVNMTN